MLARSHRIVSPADFRSTQRRGHRIATEFIVTHVAYRNESDLTNTGARFGFVVGKAVGNAVSRNRVRRRLRAASRVLLPSIAAEIDVVIRALPGSSGADWVSLQGQVADSVWKGVSRL